MLEILESGMIFGPFEEKLVFRIEGSKIIDGLGDGVKVAEFCLIRDGNKLLIVEAKSSSPKPTSVKNFDDFFTDLTHKFENSLHATLAVILGRHTDVRGEISASFTSLVLKELEVRFVLVFREHPDYVLPEISDKLQQSVLRASKAWGLGPNTVLVLNHARAMKAGLCLPLIA